MQEIHDVTITTEAPRAIGANSPVSQPPKMASLRPALLLFAAPALLAALAPAALVYDRAAILEGDWWRLVTGQWIHFSLSHTAWNLLVLIAAGTWLERLRPGALRRYTLAGAPLIGIGLLAFAPMMSTYGGLSGLAVGVVVLLALTQLDDRARTERARWVAVLLLVAGKIALEAHGGRTLFSDYDGGAYRPSVAAHILGATTALLYHACTRRGVHESVPQNSPQ